MKWAGHVACIRETRNAYKVLVGKPENMKLIVGNRRKWEYNVKMKPNEIACKAVDWMQQAQDRFQWQAAVKIINKLWGL